MNSGLNEQHPLCRACRSLPLVARTFAFAVLSSGSVFSQTASTGALTGVTLDPSGAVLPGVVLHLAQQNASAEKITTSANNGRFGFFMLRPGTYEVQASKAGFNLVSQSNIHVHVTETIRLQLHLELATHLERTQVSAESLMIQLDASALGRATNKDTISGLPLVTRNFTQITGLSPGVAVGVYNAGELGTGATALSQIGKSNDGIFVHGSRSYDNNWQLDGISVSDVQGSGPISGGSRFPIPTCWKSSRCKRDFTMRRSDARRGPTSA